MVITFALIHHSYPFNGNLPDTTTMTTTTVITTTQKSENITNTNLEVKMTKENSDTFREIESKFLSISGNATRENVTGLPFDQWDIDDALEYGLKAAKELHEIKEPQWYSMGKLMK